MKKIVSTTVFNQLKVRNIKMKKVLKVILIVVIILIVILLINSIRNIYIITKAINLSFNNIYNSNKIVNLTTSFNGEISSAKQMAKDTALSDKKISPKILLFDYHFGFKDIVFQIIYIKDNCYRIRVKDIYLYIDKDTGYRIKDEIPKMNAHVTYEYFDEK